MEFQSVVQYLYKRGNEVLTMNYSLDAMSTLAEEIGHPQTRYPSVLIAGTNGKGSVAATLDTILRTRGLRTGLYTSPHLLRIQERIRIDGEEIPAADFGEYGTRVIEAGERIVARGARSSPPTYFELVTAMAFLYFAERGVDFAVLEVGLGGRLDATNITQPECAVITSVSYDHQAWLGDTLEKIAHEKAGIIKPGTITVFGGEDEGARAVIRNRCAELNAPLIEAMTAGRLANVSRVDGYYSFDLTTPVDTYKSLRLNLRGRHQVRNAVVAVLAAEALTARGFDITKEHISNGIGRTQWRGRIDRAGGGSTLLLDGAHNVEAVAALKEFLAENYGGQRIVLIFGAMRDKDIRRIGEILFPAVTHVILTAVDNPRSETPAGIAERCRGIRDDWSLAPTLSEARRLAESIPHDVIVAAGSFYLIGEIYRQLESGYVG